MRAFREKECEFCGNSFQPTTGSAKYCGTECRKEAQRKFRMERKLEKFKPTKKKIIPIAEIQRIGRKHNLSYGDTVFAIERGELGI